MQWNINPIKWNTNGILINRIDYSTDSPAPRSSPTARRNTVIYIYHTRNVTFPNDTYSNRTRHYHKLDCKIGERYSKLRHSLTKTRLFAINLLTLCTLLAQLSILPTTFLSFITPFPYYLDNHR